MSDIQGVSKEWFKNFVKEKVKINFLKQLKDLRTKHSKSANLKCDDLKTAEYINSPRFSLEEKQLLFKLRSRTLNIKANFKNQHKDQWCISCGLSQETQSHLLECSEIVKKLGYVAGKNKKHNENFVYGSLEEQEIIVKVYGDILQIRDEIQTKQIEESNPSVEGPFAHVPSLGH